MSDSPEYDTSSVYSSGSRSSTVLPNTTCTDFVTLNKCPETILALQLVDFIDCEVEYYKQLRTLVEVHRSLLENVVEFHDLFSDIETNLIFGDWSKFADVSRTVVEELVSDICHTSHTDMSFCIEDTVEQKVQYILTFSESNRLNVGAILGKHLLDNHCYVGALLALHVKSRLVEQVLDDLVLSRPNCMKWLKQANALANWNGIGEFKENLNLPLERLKELRPFLKTMMDYGDEHGRFSTGLTLIKTNRLIDKCEAQTPAISLAELKQWYNKHQYKAVSTRLFFLGQELDPDFEFRLEGTRIKQTDTSAVLLRMIARFRSKQARLGRLCVEVHRYTLEVTRFVQSQKYFAPIWKLVLGGDGVFDQIYSMYWEKMCDLDTKTVVYIQTLETLVIGPLLEMNQNLQALSNKVDSYCRSRKKTKKAQITTRYTTERVLEQQLDWFLGNIDDYVRLLTAQTVSCTSRWLHSILGTQRIHRYKQSQSNSGAHNHNDIIRFYKSAFAASLLS